MPDPVAALRLQLSRQVAHWTIASSRLMNVEELAPAEAWRQLEQYLGLTVRRQLMESSERLVKRAGLMRGALAAATTQSELESVNRLLLDFRRRYLRTETTQEFFADAIRTRTDTTLGGLLRACDTLAYRSMAAVLDQLDRKTPVVLTYLDSGLGASILKAGLRLWDGTDCPVAAIKVTRHNLHRPTSILHEGGHQVAHLTGWTEELAKTYRSGLDDAHGAAGAWAAWASEIVADAHAFVHAGFASVAALHDVVAGDNDAVFRGLPGDPHPIPYLRVLLGVEMCRQNFGAGPWDDLALGWTTLHRLERAGPAAELIQASIPLLPRATELCLRQPMRAFRGRSICDLINPDRVRPANLREMQSRLGTALYTSTHWIWTESLRLLALTGLEIAASPDRAVEIVKQQQAWMLRLGGTAQAA